MRILQLPSYYFPEQFSSSHLAHELEEAFIDSGLVLLVIAPMPTRGVSNEARKAFTARKHESKFNGLVNIKRFAMYREGKNPVLRALRYSLINLIQYLKGVRVKGIDVVYGVSTPPTQGALCALVKKRHKVPFVYCLQDIFPDSLVNAGMTHEGSLLWKIGRAVEDFTYRNADRIIVISEGFKENILAKGVPEGKIAVIPNWVDTEKVRPITREENRLFDELGLDRSKFYVTYAGTLGPTQNVGLLLDTAEKLKEYTDISFIIFGEGTESEKLDERICNMVNFQLCSLQPSDRISEVYSLGDLSLVIARMGAGTAAVPSKTWSILAAGTPILLSYDMDSELWDIVERNECGVCARADDSEELKERILTSYCDRDGLKKMAKNARNFAVNNASKDTLLRRYIDVFTCYSEKTHCSFKN